MSRISTSKADKKLDFYHKYQFYRQTSEVTDAELFEAIIKLTNNHVFDSWKAFRHYRAYLIKHHKIHSDFKHLQCPGCGHKIGIKFS